MSENIVNLRKGIYVQLKWKDVGWYLSEKKVSQNPCASLCIVKKPYRTKLYPNGLGKTSRNSKDLHTFETFM